MAVSKKTIKNSALAKVIISSLTNLEAATIAGSKALVLATKKVFRDARKSDEWHRRYTAI